MKKKKVFLCSFVLPPLLSVFFYFPPMSVAQSKKDKDVPIEQVPVEERDPGDRLTQSGKHFAEIKCP